MCILFLQSNIYSVMKIHCPNGLSDRLGFIFSYLKKAKEANEELVVCWRENDHCNGHFLDLFEPIPGLTFTTDPNNCDVTGWLHCPDHSAFNVFLWNELRLRKDLKEEVNKLRRIFNGSYAAIHVRRTEDLFIFGKDLTTDHDFFQFVEKHKMIFLATDSSETQKIFKDKYKEKIVCSSQMKYPESNNPLEILNSSFVVTRETSLKIAVIDLYACIHSTYFMGSNHSGYSKFIEHFRKFKKEYHWLI